MNISASIRKLKFGSLLTDERDRSPGSGEFVCSRQLVLTTTLSSSSHHNLRSGSTEGGGSDFLLAVAFSTHVNLYVGCQGGGDDGSHEQRERKNAASSASVPAGDCQSSPSSSKVRFAAAPTSSSSPDATSHGPPGGSSYSSLGFVGTVTTVPFVEGWITTCEWVRHVDGGGGGGSSERGPDRQTIWIGLLIGTSNGTVLLCDALAPRSSSSSSPPTQVETTTTTSQQRRSEVPIQLAARLFPPSFMEKVVKAQPHEMESLMEQHEGVVRCLVNETVLSPAGSPTHPSQVSYPVPSSKDQSSGSALNRSRNAPCENAWILRSTLSAVLVLHSRGLLVTIPLEAFVALGLTRVPLHRDAVLQAALQHQQSVASNRGGVAERPFANLDAVASASSALRVRFPVSTAVDLRATTLDSRLHNVSTEASFAFSAQVTTFVHLEPSTVDRHRSVPLERRTTYSDAVVLSGVGRDSSSRCWDPLLVLDGSALDSRMVLVSGCRPALGLYQLVQSRPASSATASQVAGAVVSHISSAAKHVIRGLWQRYGSGGGSREQEDAGTAQARALRSAAESRQDPQLLGMVREEADFAIDRLLLDPSARYVACISSAVDRVFIVDAATGVVLSLLRGCRSVECVWVLLPVPASSAGVGGSSPSPCLALLVHHSLRGVVELYDVFGGKQRIGAVRIGQGYRLLDAGGSRQPSSSLPMFVSLGNGEMLSLSIALSKQRMSALSNTTITATAGEAQDSIKGMLFAPPPFPSTESLASSDSSGQSLEQFLLLLEHWWETLERDQVDWYGDHDRTDLTASSSQSASNDRSAPQDDRASWHVRRSKAHHVYFGLVVPLLPWTLPATSANLSHLLQLLKQVITFWKRHISTHSPSAGSSRGTVVEGSHPRSHPASQSTSNGDQHSTRSDEDDALLLQTWWTPSQMLNAMELKATALDVLLRVGGASAADAKLRTSRDLPTAPTTGEKKKNEEEASTSSYFSFLSFRSSDKLSNPSTAPLPWFRQILSTVEQHKNKLLSVSHEHRSSLLFPNEERDLQLLLRSLVLSNEWASKLQEKGAERSSDGPAVVSSSIADLLHVFDLSGLRLAPIKSLLSLETRREESFRKVRALTNFLFGNVEAVSDEESQQAVSQALNLVLPSLGFDAADAALLLLEWAVEHQMTLLRRGSDPSSTTVGDTEISYAYWEALLQSIPADAFQCVMMHTPLRLQSDDNEEKGEEHPLTRMVSLVTVLAMRLAVGSASARSLNLARMPRKVLARNGRERGMDSLSTISGQLAVLLTAVNTRGTSSSSTTPTTNNLLTCLRRTDTLHQLLGVSKSVKDNSPTTTALADRVVYDRRNYEAQSTDSDSSVAIIYPELSIYREELLRNPTATATTGIIPSDATFHWHVTMALHHRYTAYLRHSFTEGERWDTSRFDETVWTPCTRWTHQALDRLNALPSATATSHSAGMPAAVERLQVTLWLCIVAMSAQWECYLRLTQPFAAALRGVAVAKDAPFTIAMLLSLAKHPLGLSSRSAQQYLKSCRSSTRQMNQLMQKLESFRGRVESLLKQQQQQQQHSHDAQRPTTMLAAMELLFQVAFESRSSPSSLRTNVISSSSSSSSTPNVLVHTFPDLATPLIDAMRSFSALFQLAGHEGGRDLTDVLDVLLSLRRMTDTACLLSTLSDSIASVSQLHVPWDLLFGKRLLDVVLLLPNGDRHPLPSSGGPQQQPSTPLVDQHLHSQQLWHARELLVRFARSCHPPEQEGIPASVAAYADNAEAARKLGAALGLELNDVEDTVELAHVSRSLSQLAVFLSDPDEFLQQITLCNVSKVYCASVCLMWLRRYLHTIIKQYSTMFTSGASGAEENKQLFAAQLSVTTNPAKNVLSPSEQQSQALRIRHAQALQRVRGLMDPSLETYLRSNQKKHRIHHHHHSTAASHVGPQHHVDPAGGSSGKSLNDFLTLFYDADVDDAAADATWASVLQQCAADMAQNPAPRRPHAPSSSSSASQSVGLLIQVGEFVKQQYHHVQEEAPSHGHDYTTASTQALLGKETVVLSMLRVLRAFQESCVPMMMEVLLLQSSQ